MLQRKEKYLFTSERLGFRTWHKDDLEQFAALNADERVMHHFPNTLSTDESSIFLDRLIQHHKEHAYCYFATELLDTATFIGFIGLAYQTYPALFTPATDIGWRLIPTAWNQGYASEGAKRCLQYAFEELRLHQIVATCTLSNKKSEKIMKKIGMTRKGVFNHPNLSNYPELEKCIYYLIERPNLI